MLLPLSPNGRALPLPEFGWTAGIWHKADLLHARTGP